MALFGCSSRAPVGDAPDNDLGAGGWTLRIAAPLAAILLFAYLLRAPNDPSLRERLAATPADGGCGLPLLFDCAGFGWRAMVVPGLRSRQVFSDVPCVATAAIGCRPRALGAFRLRLDHSCFTLFP